ncbi:hypothetical protein HMPREF3056_05370 [Corynebacterium sp. HMSC056F09]|nr:hypothetical protein HMPREF3056_05370 [Corynebacterium sp. HMSC056F09]
MNIVLLHGGCFIHRGGFLNWRIRSQHLVRALLRPARGSIAEECRTGFVQRDITAGLDGFLHRSRLRRAGGLGEADDFLLWLIYVDAFDVFLRSGEGGLWGVFSNAGACAWRRLTRRGGFNVERVFRRLKW